MAEVHSGWILGGGIASGKSQVRGLLSQHGVPTVDADTIGHQVLAPDGSAYLEVATTWPDVVIDGAIDRSMLAARVFSDPGELARLEAITHPHIFDSIRSQVEEFDTPVVVELPLLNSQLGSGWRRITVDCSDAVRLIRAVERGMTEEDARSRMKVQPPRAAWLAAADLIIPNHGSLENLVSTVRKVIPTLMT